jgi:hypothetical protein
MTNNNVSEKMLSGIANRVASYSSCGIGGWFLRVVDLVSISFELQIQKLVCAGLESCTYLLVSDIDY